MRCPCSSPFWFHSHALVHSSHVSHVPRASRIPARPARSRTSVRSPQYPPPSLACQRHLLPRLFSLFSLKLTSFRASRNSFLLGLPSQVPRALNLTGYLCASVRILPRVPLIRPLRCDLLFLSSRSLSQVVATPYEVF